MKLIKESINDIKNKLDIYKTELIRLEKEKRREESIDPFSIKTNDFSKIVVSGGKRSDMLIKDEKYIAELNKKIEILKNEIKDLESILKMYIDRLSQMDGIEYILYSNILKGYNITNAVEKTVEQYNDDKVEREWISVPTVWRKYKKIKENLI